jgi:hypothetical protein
MVTSFFMHKPLVGLLLLGVAACAHSKPPPLQTMTLAAYKASYRDTKAPKTNVCSADFGLLAQEIDGMNALLEAFLGGTSAPAEGVWSEEHLTLLADAQKVLPATLDAYESELKQANVCKFKKGDLSEPAKKGLEYVRQARSRLVEAPALIAGVELKQAVQKWHQGLVSEEQSAQAQWCPPKPKPGSIEIYFAFQDEKGHWEWHFCDGGRVQAQGGGPGEFVPPVGDKKKHKPKPYLDAALKYPNSEVHRPPSAPAPVPAAEKAEAPPDKPAEDKDKAEPTTPPPDP